MNIARLIKPFLFLFVLSLPTFAQAAKIDEIAYLTNKVLKELSTKAVSLVTSPNLGVCGRRRELKITGRSASEKWPEILQSAVKRDESTKRSVRLQEVTRSSSSVDSAVNRILLESGYHSESPSDTDDLVKSFKTVLRNSYNDFLIFSGQVKGADSNQVFSFLALVDEKQNECLIVSLGEELCR
ncbi:MAG: hypothetical protein ABL958_21060 [Bdellovibrionia bacterium]